MKYTSLLTRILLCVVFVGCRDRYPKDNSDIIDILGPTSNWIDTRQQITTSANFVMFEGLHEYDGMSMFRKIMPLIGSLGALNLVEGKTNDEKQAQLSRIINLFENIYLDPMYAKLGFDKLEPVYQLSLPMYIGNRPSYRIPYGHYYLYIPPDIDRTQPISIALFLHGRGPNMTAWLSRLVKGTNESMVIISPTSGGTGNWADAENKQLALSVINRVVSRLQIDRYHLHAIGHSNGCIGAVELAMQYPNLFESVIAVASGWSNFDYLRQSQTSNSTKFDFICGDLDHYAPLSVQAVQKLRIRGYNAELHIEAGQDHHIIIDDSSALLKSAFEKLTQK